MNMCVRQRRLTSNSRIGSRNLRMCARSVTLSYDEGFEGRPIPDIAKGDAKLLEYYEKGLRALEIEIAVTDAENGIGSVGWGNADGSWTRQDSEAAWEKLDQRSR